MNTVIEDQKNAIRQTRLDTFQAASLCSPLQRADFKETTDTSLYAWGVEFAIGNGILEKNGDRIPTEKEIDQTIAYFSAKKLPFIWWSSAKVLETKGFQFAGVLSGIALDISEGLPKESAKPSNLKIEIVQSKSGLEIFNELVVNAFGMSPTIKEQMLAINEAVMKEGKQIHLLAYLNGEAVGAATLSISTSTAGIWNLTTLPEHRKQGIGSALVLAALKEAKKRDKKQIIAILMPKGMAFGVFTGLGFNSVCEFPFYAYGASTDEIDK